MSTTNHAYWKSQAYRNDYIHCECSNCGFTIEAIYAVNFGSSSDNYTSVKYHFCPNCGSIMSIKNK